MKLLLAAALAATLSAAAADDGTEAPEPARAGFLQQGQSFTCPEREGCLVLNRAGAEALVKNAAERALAACRKGGV